VGGYDIGASLSGSSSATAGLQGDFREIFGDHIVGKKPVPIWLPLAAIGALVFLGIIFLIRR